MDSYVVRIYRRDGKKPRILIGTVEAAGTDMRVGFSNIEELWEILRCRRTGIFVVSATPPTEAGDERDGYVRPRGIRGGSAPIQTRLRTLRGGVR